MKWLILLSVALLPLAGCSAATGTDCNSAPLVYNITPASGTANHIAAAPGNQVKFTALESVNYPAGYDCPIPSFVFTPFGLFTSSDPINVTIDSSQGPTNGVATCVGATNGPVTLTATSSTGTSSLTATATLTCQ